MKMSITQTEMEHMAKLCKLEIAEEDKQEAAAAFFAVINYARQLQEADISNIEPTTHVLPLVNVLREDKLIPCLPREQALALAPESEEGFFKVPSIL